MTPPEFTRPFPLERLAGGLNLTVQAEPGERAQIARRLLVPSVESLRCEWALRPAPSGVVVADGVLHAALHQECVVTLEPFAVELREAFSVRFVPVGQESEEADDPAAPDELPYEGDALDLGEASVEQLALALDPYPRKPGAVLPEDAAADLDNPFDALARRFRPE